MTLLNRFRKPPLAVELPGQHVVLTPLRPGDIDEIARLPDDPAYALLLRRFTGGPRAARAWVRQALSGMHRGDEMCWVIRRADTRELVGSTRYLNVDLANARLEVGATWIVAAERGGPANAESKLLVLDHAFERLRVRRVHIQADVRNARSRAAIEALGASFEGVLREHIVLPDGTSRDTAVYSITRSDWPACRERIAGRVAERAARAVSVGAVPVGAVPVAAPTAAPAPAGPEHPLPGLQPLALPA